MGNTKCAENNLNCDNNKCFAYELGKCRVLISNDFNGRSCPFFKTAGQLAEEEHKRLLRAEQTSV